jgi:hypothetical protein
LLKGTQEISTIAAAVPAKQGYLKWIPTGLTPASDYKIKIATIDTTVYDTSDNSFTITTAGTTGNMQLNTNPTAATIYMDEGLVSRVSSGSTNKLFSGLKAGDYLIEVTKSDSWPKRSIVTVVSGLTKTFSFTLLPLTDPSGNTNGGLLPRIDLNSDPVGAEIFIDGISQGPDTPTPAQIEVSPGPHDVSVKLPNYNPSAVKVTVQSYDPDPEADNIMVIDTFVLTPSPKTVTVQVLIVPQPLNIGRKGYFLAFVKLPTGYKAADVIEGSVSCEGASALKLVRLKLFPQIFAAIFQRQDLGTLPTGDFTMNVKGEIKGSDGNVPFTGSKIVNIINKKVTTKEDVDSVMTMTDTQIFTKFNKL